MKRLLSGIIALAGRRRFHLFCGRKTVLWLLMLAPCCLVASWLAEAEAYELGPELQLSREFVQPTYVIEMIEHTPDVAVSGNFVVAAWVLGRRDIAWSSSIDGGANWTYGGQLPVLEETHDFAFPTVCADEAGVFHIAAVNTNSRGREAITVYELSYQNDQFVVTGPEFPVPRLDPTQGRYQFPRLACDPATGRLFLSYTLFDGQDRPTSSFIYLTMRIDSNWTVPAILSNGMSNGSSIVIGPDHELYAFWDDFQARSIVGRRSLDQAESFEAPFVVASTNENFTLPPGATQNNRPNPLYPCNDDDLALNYPSIGVDRSLGPNRGHLYAVWTEQTGGHMTAITAMMSEIEPNGTPAEAMRLPLDSQITGTATYVHGEGGERDVFYFDGAEGQVISFEGHSSVPCGGYVIEEPWGNPFLFRYMMRAFEPVTPPVVFTIPSNRRYYLVFGSGGFSVGYNVRLKRLIPEFQSAARDHRDVVMATSPDGGFTWTPKVLINDDPPRFDNYLPRLTVDALGGIHVAWYDRRDDPTSGADYNVYWRYSGDGGSTFLPSVRLSETISALPHTAYRVYMGDYLALGATSSGAIALWTQIQSNPAYPEGTDQDINLRRVAVERAIAIQIDKLRATASSKWVRLTWRVTNPDQVWRFRIFRQAGDAADYELFGTVEGFEGDRGRFEFMDGDVAGGQSISYKIQVVQTDATLLWSEPVDVTVPGTRSLLDMRVELHSPGTVLLNIDAGSNPGSLKVRIFDVRGAEIRTLHDGPVESGLIRLLWDGRDNSGRLASAGIYFVEAAKGAERARAKLIRYQPSR